VTLIVLAMGRVGVQEQTITGNEQRSYKAIDAAEAGLEYGMDWLTQNMGKDFDTLKDGSTASWPRVSEVSPTTVPLLPFLDVTPGDGESYKVQLRLERVGTGTSPPYVKVTASAFDANEATAYTDASSARARVSQYAALSVAGNPNYVGGPPLVMNGCFLDKTKGTPDIYPASSGDYAGQSILPSTGAWNLQECVDAGYSRDPKAMCFCPTNNGDRPHIELHGGDVLSTPADGLSGNPTNLDTWNTLFPAMTQEEFKAASADEATKVANNEMLASDRTYYYIPDTAALGNVIKTTMGSGDASTTPPTPEKLVLIFLDPAVGCPKLNGGTTIWGTIYFGGDCSSDGMGWGNGVVYGSVGVESSLEVLNSKFAIYGLDLSGLNLPAGENTINVRLVRVPGSWSDDG
jgi:hypothetical protein